MRPAQRSAAIALTVLALSLTGCGALVVPRSAQPDQTASIASPAPAPSATELSPTPAPGTSSPSSARGECGGVAVEISGTGTEHVLTGDCPSVTIAGQDLEVDLTRAVVGALRIGGDRIEVDAGSVSELSIQGQGNDVDTQQTTSLAIAGDRNEVDVVGELGSVTVTGNGNEVEAGSLGAVATSGSGNQITTR